MVSPIKFLLLLITHWACSIAIIPTNRVVSLRVSTFPAFGPCHNGSDVVTSLGDVVEGLEVEIPTEATDMAEVAAGEVDQEVPVPVIGDPETKICLQSNTKPTGTDPQLPVCQEHWEQRHLPVNPDFSVFIPAEGDALSIDINIDQGNIGHRLDSTTNVILGLDPEGHQPRVIPMGFSHGVGAGSLEVEVKAIEGAEVWVTPCPARGNQGRDAVGLGTAGPTALLGAAAQGLAGVFIDASQDAFPDFAGFVLSASMVMAGKALTRDTGAAALAAIPEKHLMGLIVFPIPKASTVLLGNASLSIKDGALVALAALCTGLGTGGGISSTGVGAGVGAKGVGAVGRAGEGAEGWCPPTPHSDSSILARSDIALDTLAQDMRVPSSHTEVMDAGLGIRDRVNDAMARAKGTFRGREEATVVGFLEDCHFFLCAGGTLILGTGVIARCVHCFPCGSKGCRIWSQLATGELEIIIVLAIVVATEATQMPHVDLGHRDHHMLDEVIVDNKAKVSAEQDTCPMWVDLDLSLTQDGGEVVGDGIHHDICPFSLFQGQDDPIDFHRQRLDPGDLPLLPCLLLDCDNK